MPKIRLILEDIDQEVAEQLRRDLSQIPGAKVTIAQAPVNWPLVMPELTPEQQKAFEEEWNKPAFWHAWLDEHDPSPAIDEHLTDIDADETPEDIRIRIRDDVARLCGMITHLEAQLSAEGAHTEAAWAEVERMRTAAVAEIAARMKPDPKP